MKELDQSSVAGIETGQIRVFVPTKMQTSQRQIVQFREAAVLACRGVIDVKGQRKNSEGS